MTRRPARQARAWIRVLITALAAAPLSSGFSYRWFDRRARRVRLRCRTRRDVDADSLAESFLRAPDGGAVAVRASSALTEPVGQDTLNDFLVRSLLSGQIETIGEAARQAKLAGGDRDQHTRWILFGDPVTRLRIAR